MVNVHSGYVYASYERVYERDEEVDTQIPK